VVERFLNNVVRALRGGSLQNGCRRSTEKSGDDRKSPVVGWASVLEENALAG